MTKVFFALISLWPAILHSEQIEFQCAMLNGARTPLVFDTGSRSVKYGFWPESQSSYWDESFIYWTAISVRSSGSHSAASFIFKRETSELIASAVYPELFDVPTLLNSANLIVQCNRGF